MYKLGSSPYCHQPTPIKIEFFNKSICRIPYDWIDPASCKTAQAFHHTNPAWPESASWTAGPIEAISGCTDAHNAPGSGAYDVCACKDGSLVIYHVKRCGNIDWGVPGWPHVTSYRWK